MLKGMVVAQPLDGPHGRAFDLCDRDQTRTDRFFIDEYRACAALALAAAFLGACQSQVHAKNVEQARHRVHRDVDRAAVYSEAHVDSSSGVAGTSRMSSP